MINTPDTSAETAPSSFRPEAELLASERITVEHKIFLFDLKQNQRGRFVRITEESNGRRNSIILPVSGVPDFARAFAQILEVEKRSGQ
jgi:hypothetical protein